MYLHLINQTDKPYFYCGGENTVIVLPGRYGWIADGSGHPLVQRDGACDVEDVGNGAVGWREGLDLTFGSSTHVMSPNVQSPSENYFAYGVPKKVDLERLLCRQKSFLIDKCLK